MNKQTATERGEDWLFAHRQSTLVGYLTAAISPSLRFYLYLTGAYDRYIECEKIVANLKNIGTPHANYGFFTYWQQAEELNRGLDLEWLLLFGNHHEQAEFRKHYNPSNLVEMPTSTNTLEQAEKIASFCQSHEVTSIGLLAHETLICRATLTLMKQFMGSNQSIPILPFSFIGPDRVQLPGRLRRFGMANEARKLAAYQRRCHVAEADEAIEYISAFNGQVVSVPDTICIVY